METNDVIIICVYALGVIVTSCGIHEDSQKWKNHFFGFGILLSLLLGELAYFFSK